MLRRIWWCWFLGTCLLTGCAGPTVNPAPIVIPPRPAPVDPVPIPVPIPPPGPGPVIPPPVVVEEHTDPTNTTVVEWTKVQTVTAGQDRGALVTALGRKPIGDKDMRDGTRMSRWPAVDDEGVAKWLDVQVEVKDPKDRSKDEVLGFSLVPRR